MILFLTSCESLDWQQAKMLSVTMVVTFLSSFRTTYRKYNVTYLKFSVHMLLWYEECEKANIFAQLIYHLYVFHDFPNISFLQLTVLNKGTSHRLGSLGNKIQNFHFKVKENNVEYFYPGSRVWGPCNWNSMEIWL